MMKNLAKTAILAVALATAGMAASTATASAGEARFSITIGSGGFGWHGGHHRGHRWDRRHYRRGCSAQQALRKADRMGIRHARVVDADRRIVKVRGRKHGHRVKAVFANSRHCPVVRVRMR